MIELKNFTWTAREQYWQVERVWNDRTEVWNMAAWTAALHRPDCRYAPTDGRRAYAGQDGLTDLARHGLGITRWTGSSRTVWKGCKVCGTASIPSEEWQAAAQAALDRTREAQAAARAAERAREAELARREDARRSFAAAQDAAEAAWLAQHAPEIRETRAEAAARWLGENLEVPVDWLT